MAGAPRLSKRATGRVMVNTPKQFIEFLSWTLAVQKVLDFSLFRVEEN
jgi:hypothetical protein